MKNLFLIILTIILLQNCKSSSDLFLEDYNPGQDDILQSGESSNVFSSRDLETLYSNKKKVKVALFLPMSGSNASLGELLYNSALMSLFDNDKNHNIELVLIDSKDNPIDSSQIFKKEIVRGGIKTVIGPIFSKQIDIISRNALRYNVNVISLSNNQEMMDRVEDNSAIFLAGFLPQQQIDKIISHLQENQINDIAIIAPNNSYGIAISQIIKDTIKNRDALLIQSDLYDNSSNRLSKVVERILKAYKVPTQMTEGGGRIFEEDYRVLKSDRKYARAIIVVDSSDNTAKISHLIKKYNDTQRDILLVGVGSWDDREIEGKNFATKVIYAAPNPDKFKRFERSFYNYYKKYPPRISSIVYDSVASIAQIVDRNGNRTPSTKDFIEYQDSNDSQPGFSGIDGRFRFLSNGLVQRQYPILELDSNKFREIPNSSDSKFLEYLPSKED